MKKIFLFVSIMLMNISVVSQIIEKPVTVKMSPLVEITQISQYTYLYTFKMPSVDYYPANGMFCINEEGHGFLVDTPGDDKTTDSLIEWIRINLKAEIKAAVITHWHMEDRMGGLNALNKRGIETYADSITYAIAVEKNLPKVKHIFTDTLTLKDGEMILEAWYPGPGHTIDNSVVWFPEDKVLFGGCLIKSLKSKDKGNTADADVKAWPETVKNVMEKYPDAKVVIPGHLDYDGINLFRHTINLLNK